MMATRRAGGATPRQIRTLFDLGPIGDLTDGQLLERFATDPGEAAELAFAALVERHEALVWRACRAVLGDRHRAEDAFQATFLVLARRGRSLWVRDSLGPWLHQVARRTASCLRAADRRRAAHERRAAGLAPDRPTMPEPRDPDLAGVVHEAVDRLPAKFRAPLVLCDLEGRTHAEAARALGWPIGTVKSRQAEGRRLLRDRLARRGLSTVAVAAAVDSLGRAAGAAVPRAAVAAAVRGAIRPGVGVSAGPFALARRVGRGLAWVWLRPVAGAGLALGLVAGGAGLVGPGPGSGGPVASAPVDPPGDDVNRLNLRAQELVTGRALIAAKVATLHREETELAVAEYVEVAYPRDLAAAEAEIERARAELKRAESRFNWSREMLEKGYVPQATNVADGLSLDRTKFDLEQAETQMQVLTKYTRDKRTKALNSDVDRARADAWAKRATWERERAREHELKHLPAPDPWPADRPLP